MEIDYVYVQFFSHLPIEARSALISFIPMMQTCRTCFTPKVWKSCWKPG